MATGLYSKLDELIAAYPALVPVDTVIGQSVQGRDIRAVHLTAGTNKPQIALIAAQHASEWLAHHGTIYMIAALLKRAGVSRPIYDFLSSHELVVIPVMNPDGYEYARLTDRQWRKNRRDNGDGTFGVDPNRNWSHDWAESTGGSTITSEITYRGPSAQSEPETDLTDIYIRALRDLRAVIDFHCISGDFGTYEGYIAIPGDSVTQGSVPAGDAADFAVLRTAVKNACDANGFIVYDPDPSFSTNSGGTLRNHAYWQWNVPSLLFEGHADANYVAPASDIILQGEDILTAVLTLAEHFNFV